MSFFKERGKVVVKRPNSFIFRSVFIIFGLLFIEHAFYKWDTFSFYMRFIDLLPDLSLIYILWMTGGILFAALLCLAIYFLQRITPSFADYSFLVAWFAITALVMYVKRLIFPDLSIGNITGMGRIGAVLAGSLLVALAVLSLRRFIEKAINALDIRIAPLLWIFLFLLILALPFSIFKAISAGDRKLPGVSEEIVDSVGERPNIILVIIDTLTALDMQVYGYERKTTPFISEWAADATLFRKAYATTNWTTPSMMNIMTGQRIWTHKVWHRAVFHPVDEYANNMLRILNDNNYEVIGMIQNSFAHPDILGMKSDLLVKDKSHTFSIPSGWWFEKISTIFADRPIVQFWIKNIPVLKQVLALLPKPSVSSTLVPPEMVYNRFLDYMDQRETEKSGKPFFAWLHVLPPHDLYLPPKPYTGLYGDAGKYDTSDKQTNSFTFYTEYKPERQPDVDVLRKRYDEFILYSDVKFEEFMSSLSERFDINNTIVILASDHGESFSHGFLGHDGPHLYEPLVHVPLIIKRPGEESGKTIDVPVELTDLAPTILDLAGINTPEWMEGRTLVPLLEGKPHEPRPVFSMQLIKNSSLGQAITNGTIAVWDGQYKLIHYLEENKSLLFDLKTDPDETINLYNSKPEISGKLKELIEERLSAANKIITRSSE